MQLSTYFDHTNLLTTTTRVVWRFTDVLRFSMHPSAAISRARC